MKYIRKNGKGYQIKKRINGKTTAFGTYSTLEKAIQVRDDLIENNWDIGTFHKYCPPNPLKNIRKLNGKYAVIKQINKEKILFGSALTLEEAIKERDLLERCNWDLDCLCDLSLGDNHV